MKRLTTFAIAETKNVNVTLEQGNALVVQLTGNNSFDGTVDLQTSTDGSNYVNHPYESLHVAAPTRSVSQLTSISTRTSYLLVPPAHSCRIKVTFVSTGDIDVSYQEVTLPFDPASSAASLAVDGIGVDGTTDYANQFDQQTIAGLLFGLHQTVNILFVIPEAVASINTSNAAILTELQKHGHVDTIVQGDALTYPDFAQYNMIVCGSNIGTAWTDSNLVHVKEFPESVLCFDDVAAAKFLIGSTGGDAAAKTVLVAVTQIEANDLGIGHGPDTGLAAGNNTISASTIYNTLDMSAASITETFFGTENTADNTDVLLGCVFKRLGDGTRGLDSAGEEVKGTRWFYGPGFSAVDLTTLGLAVIGLITHMAIQASTEVGFEVSGDIGDLETKIFGNQASGFNNGNPWVEYLSGRNSEGTKNPIGKSLYDILGAAYVDGGGGVGTDSVLSDLGLIHTQVLATAVGKKQVATATIDLHQAAASYDLLTGTTQDFMMEGFSFKMPNIDVSDDCNITAVTIQTDDVTPQVLFDATAGAIANLTAEGELTWYGRMKITTGTKIQLTIVGGTADTDPTTCLVTADGFAIVAGGNLA